MIFVNINTVFLFLYLKELIVAHALIKHTGAKIKKAWKTLFASAKTISNIVNECSEKIVELNFWFILITQMWDTFLNPDQA